MSGNYHDLVSSDPQQPDPTVPVPQPLTADEEAVLRSLGRVVHALPRAVDADMIREQRLSLIESLGLIQRVRSEQDARGWNAVLTDTGLARLREAWPTNLASVRHHFLDHLAGLDLGRLAAALRNIAT